MRFEDLSDFVRCYNPRNRAPAKAPMGRRGHAGRPLAQLQLRRNQSRDKTSLDISWLRDKSLTDLDNLPEPDDLAEEIITRTLRPV